MSNILIAGGSGYIGTLLVANTVGKNLSHISGAICQRA